MFKGLITGYANCGKHHFSAEQGINVEVLSPEISGHGANIVCYYYMEGSKKVEVTYYEEAGRFGSEIYFFKGQVETGHYFSRSYPMCQDMPAKYSEIVNALKAVHREVFGERTVFTSEDVQKDSYSQDWQNKVMVLSASALKPAYQKKENQLWFATSGFGCSPTALGTAVYGICLGDGEQSRWRRGDFLGIYNGKLTDEQKARIANVVQFGIEALEKQLSAGQETGAGGFKYEHEGDAREDIKKQLNYLYDLM